MFQGRDVDQPKRSSKTVGSVAIFLGLLGTWWGTLSTALQNDGASMFSIPPYSHTMLGSSLLGVAAITLGYANHVQRGRSKQTILAVVLGVAAIVSPLVALVVAGLMVLLIIVVFVIF